MFVVEIDDSQLQKFLIESPPRARWANSEALKMAGGHWRGIIRNYIERGGRGWKPLSALTAARKKNKSPLFLLGRLVRFRYGTSRGTQRVQIGFFPTRTLKKRERLKTGRRYSLKHTGAEAARFKRSFNMTDQALARLHEFGKRRRVSQKMRGYMGAVGTPLKKTTKSLMTPARPMITPIFRRDAHEMAAYYRKRFFQKFFSEEKPRLAF